jgi:hypothetical protein
MMIKKVGEFATGVITVISVANHLLITVFATSINDTGGKFAT